MTQTQMAAYLTNKIRITKREAKSALDELNELVTRQQEQCIASQSLISSRW